MLHYDIYRIIALWADPQTLLQIIRTNCEISAPCTTVSFWEEVLSLNDLPNTRPQEPTDWITQYQKLTDHKKDMATFLGILGEGAHRGLEIDLSSFPDMSLFFPESINCRKFLQIHKSVKDILGWVNLLVYSGSNHNYNLILGIGYWDKGNISDRHLSRTITQQQLIHLCFLVQYHGGTVETW